MERMFILTLGLRRVMHLVRDAKAKDNGGEYSGTPTSQDRARNRF